MKKLFAWMQTSSVRDLLKISFLVIILSFLCVSAINLMYLRAISNRSAQQIGNIESANRLSRVAKNDVNRYCWYIVSGRESFADSPVYEEIQSIQASLDTLQANTTAAGSRKMVEAALNATHTLKGYVDRLQEQTLQGAPISYQQQTIGEIGKVSDSIYDVLQEFAYAQIDDVSAANQQLERNVVVTMLMLAALTLVAAAVALTAYRILKDAVERPNVELAAMADRVRRGDLSTRVAPPGLEEMNQLTDSLNLMARRIQALVDSSIQEQRNRQKSEMRALQAQITPHFLYNTFDTIVWLADCGHTEEVVQITVAFSNYYRIALSRGQDFIPVEREIQHVRDYLVIQKIRYGDLLRYTIQVDERMNDRFMLKLLLQPIVENALYHGLKNRRGGGEIVIKGALLSDGSLHFVVKDDGIGMDAETLARLKAEITSDSLPETSGYGLYNVNQRLRLFYNAADLDISSEVGSGTRVEFVLPPREEGEA